jgi:XTP/dITP diphosphohydrolase
MADWKITDDWLRDGNGNHAEGCVLMTLWRSCNAQPELKLSCLDSVDSPKFLFCQLGYLNLTMQILYIAVMLLIFATNNQHKVDEISAVLPPFLEVKTMKQVGIDVEIDEPHDTLEANALEKSKFLYDRLGHNVFSEDSGLFVEALNGKPGVKSARYAGEERNMESNIDKVLNELNGVKERKAYFKTVISLFWKNNEYQFDGICAGEIALERSGINGFGYDPIFIPDGATKCFGCMSKEEKQAFSHRQKAFQKLILFLQDQP